ncbi:MAG: hypothetical protein GY868_14125, partial [Deltaproteobacteria bacterium]|nr:hypothetical protein [Deltaproteobacteria bacterium]
MLPQCIRRIVKTVERRFCDRARSRRFIAGMRAVVLLLSFGFFAETVGQDAGAAAEGNIFSRIDAAEPATVRELSCEDTGAVFFAAAEICEMRDGAIFSFTVDYFCNGFRRYPEAHPDSILVVNRATAIFIRFQGWERILTNTHVLYYGGTRYADLPERDIAFFPVETARYPYTDTSNAVWIEPHAGITSAVLDGKTVTVYGISNKRLLCIAGTALYSRRGLWKTHGAVRVTGVQDRQLYLENRFALRMPS